MIDLYALNSDLAALADKYGVTPDTFVSVAEYDEWLDDLTHTVADALDAEY